VQFFLSFSSGKAWKKWITTQKIVAFGSSCLFFQGFVPFGLYLSLNG